MKDILGKNLVLHNATWHIFYAVFAICQSLNRSSVFFLKICLKRQKITFIYDCSTFFIMRCAHLAFVTYYSFVEYSHNDVFGLPNSSALRFP